MEGSALKTALRFAKSDDTEHLPGRQTICKQVSALHASPHNASEWIRAWRMRLAGSCYHEHLVMQALVNKLPQSKLKVVAVIPARLASARLPRKVLLPIAGRPMIAWVHEAACACAQLDQVIIATDSEEVVQFGQSQGWDVRMTSPELASGSDRVYAVSLQVDADLYVNVQGDEPLLRPEHIDALLRPFALLGDAVEVATLSTSCRPEDINNPNAVKVVTAQDGRALYFSRATIPFNRDAAETIPYRKHLGLYAYRKAALARFAALPPGNLEHFEKLEQLRMLEAGMSIYVQGTEFDTIGVDTEADLQRAELHLLQARVKAPREGR